jgi:hypothetical protein
VLIEMPVFSTAQRLKIALGGFVSFVGLIIVVSVVLDAAGAVNLEAVFQEGLALAVVSAVAALDVACGAMLLLRKRDIKMSFASHQKKTNNHAE